MRASFCPRHTLNTLVLKRMEPPDFTPRMIPINLKDLFSGARYNIELKPQDNIVIFSKWFFKDKPYVIVEGEVRGNRDEPLKTGPARDVDLRSGAIRFGDLRNDDAKDPTWLGRAEIDWKTLDELRKAGITRLDDPRLSELRGVGSVGGPEIDQRTIDELRRAGILSLDDPRLTLVRRQLWPGSREIDQRTIDELRRAGILSLDDPQDRADEGGNGDRQARH